MSREAIIERVTSETKINLEIKLDGKGESSIFTEIGFLDHMLTVFASYAFLDLHINVEGDIEIDSHHTVEDVAIVLGKAIKEALSDNGGIVRHGHTILPMEDALVLCALDISGKPYLDFEAEFTTPKLGMMETEMIEEFFRALSIYAGLNLHIKVLAGKNNHHIAEAIFKAFAKAFDDAKKIDVRYDKI